MRLTCIGEKHLFNHVFFCCHRPHIEFTTNLSLPIYRTWYLDLDFFRFEERSTCLGKTWETFQLMILSDWRLTCIGEKHLFNHVFFCCHRPHIEFTTNLSLPIYRTWYLDLDFFRFEERSTCLGKTWETFQLMILSDWRLTCILTMFFGCHRPNIEFATNISLLIYRT